MVKEYKKRVADQMLADKLEAAGAVLVEGPKYCGKTTLSKQQAKSILSMADPDTLSQNLALARTNISRLLKGETPRLIDEWQIAPQFWDAVRNEVDAREDDGQFKLGLSVWVSCLEMRNRLMGKAISIWSVWPISPVGADGPRLC
jgi:Predicted ATPase (AAA+ superfamily)